MSAAEQLAAEQRRHGFRPQAIRSFVVALLIALGGVALLVAIGLAVWLVAKPAAAPPDAWVAIAGLLLATPAAIAAAWATVRLGEAALRVSVNTLEATEATLRLTEAQKRREDSAFTQARVERLLAIFGGMRSALSDLLAAVVPVYVLVHDQPKTADGQDLDLPPAAWEAFLAAYARAAAPVQTAARALMSSLASLSEDPYAMAVVDERRRRIPSLLAGLKTSVGEDALLESKPFDVDEVRGLLLVLDGRITDYRHAVMPQWVATNMSGGHAGGSSLLMTGGLLLMTDNNKSGGDWRMMSVGTALLVDLSNLLPEREDAHRAFAAIYPHIGPDATPDRFLLKDPLFPMGASIAASLKFVADHPGRVTFPETPELAPS